MTAGSGIIHQEMPKQTEGAMRGLQLWVNLPSGYKLMKPRYQDVNSSGIPEITMKGNVRVKLIAGELDGHSAPVGDIVCDPRYLDVIVPAGQLFEHEVTRGHTVFAFILNGRGSFAPESGDTADAEHLVLYEDGDAVAVEAREEELRFLLISGKPIGEPVAWRGPIVMNTDEELMTAFEEYRNGTFIR
jgi:redox-sensitive bicupin YhaK (pirin superfamily)